MDDHNHDDPLDALIRGTRQRGQQQDSTPGDDPGGQQGLNPFDVLGLPPAQRDLINWLSRHKQARFEELQQALGLDADHLDAVLADLKKAQYIHEALIGGEVYYRVVFRGKVSRAGRSLPDSIWDRIDLDNMVFLRQVPLFANLSDSELEEIADKLETRHYRRKEIVLWQGGTGEGIYFVKNGVVAVNRLLGPAQETQILAYLTQGDLLGEMSLLSEKGPSASATATALSDVEILLMKRRDFRELLEKYPGVAVELAHMLTRRLQATNTRLTVGEKETSLTLVFGAAPGAGCTTTAMALAMTLQRSTQQSVVFTEYPDARRIASQLGFAPGKGVFTHPGDFDVAVSPTISGLPSSAYATMVMDRLLKRYTHVIVSICGHMDDTIGSMLERADQVVLVVPPEKTAWRRLEALRERLLASIRPERTGLFVVCNRLDRQHRHSTLPGLIDFDVPYLGTLPPLAEMTYENLPGPLIEMAAAVADRLGRTNQIAVYIPVALEGDQAVDTRAYVDKTLDFLRKRFGGTGELHSEQVRLVSDMLYLVQANVTPAEMERYLGEVLEYVDELKAELGQDAMALEVNQKVMLI